MSESEQAATPEIVVKRFDRNDFQEVRVCSLCGRERSIKQFRNHYGKKNASPRCKSCSDKMRARKQKLLADKNARDVIKLMSQQVKNAKARRAPHISDIQGMAIELLGGPHQYVKRMVDAIDRAIVDGKHKVVQDYYLAIARWSVDSHADITDADFSKLSEEELEALANEMATQALRNELGFRAEAIPVLADNKRKQREEDEDNVDLDELDDSEIDDLDDLGEWIDPANQ